MKVTPSRSVLRIRHAISRLLVTLPYKHGSLSDHHIDGLANTLEHILLDVRYTVLLTDGFYPWLSLLVGKHGQVWEHVVFNLVVQPSMCKVIEITTSPEVY